MTEATDPEASEPSPEEPARPTPSRRVLWLLLGPIIALSVAGMLADWFAPALVNDHKLLQMFLNPRNRYLATAAVGDPESGTQPVDVVPFFVVGFLRLVLTDPLFYLLGYFYGDAGLRWMERKLEGRKPDAPDDEPGAIRMLEKLFAKAAYPIVLLMPNGYICMMAGATGMRPAVFMTLNIAGTAGRLVAIRTGAHLIQDQLNAFLGFVREYQWWLTGLSVTIGVWQFLLSRRRGKSDIESISAIEQELRAAEEQVAADRAAGRELPTERLRRHPDQGAS